jgi:hypothetical protein
MRTKVLIAVLFVCAMGLAQKPNEDDVLVKKVRALYDTPFERGLINFDCAVNFDNKQQLIDTFGSVPPAALAIANILDGLHYRILVDSSGAVASAQNKVDLTRVPHANEIEALNRQTFAAGLNNWLPFALGQILPLPPVQSHFEKSPAGYTLNMQGPEIKATLQLDNSYHLVHGTSEQPQNLEFKTEFVDGPQGLLLSSDTTNVDNGGDSNFQYTYQRVDSFQLPAMVTISSATGALKMSWHYTLTDCKTQHGVVIQVSPPKS